MYIVIITIFHQIEGSIGYQRLPGACVREVPFKIVELHLKNSSGTRLYSPWVVSGLLQKCK